MMRKIFGVKSISHLIYGLLMLAPILAIGVKSAYVVINKNAKDSYYGETINQKQYSSISNIELNKTYYFQSQNDLNSQILPNNQNIQITFDNMTILYSQPSFDSGVISKIENANNGFMYFNSGTGTRTLALREDENAYAYLNMTTTIFELEFTNLITTNDDEFSKYLQLITYNNDSYLDNVFYYAIDEIIQDNNFGKINFTGWFDNMMLDNNIQINQTYTHLFNWYLNYTLFISCAYILWLVLMWFVNFARKLLDRGMNYDW